MACNGINECSKKSCIELEQCVYKLYNVVPISKKAKKAQRKLAKKNKEIQPCAYKFLCTKVDVCGILGSCIYSHPLIKDNAKVKRIISRLNDIKSIVKECEKLMPSLKRIGTKRFDKR